MLYVESAGASVCDIRTDSAAASLPVANDLDPDTGMDRLPDAKQEVELHLGLLLVQRMWERDLEQPGPLDPLARALAPAQEIEQVVDKILVA